MDFEQQMSPWSQMPTEEELMMAEMAQSQGTAPPMALQGMSAPMPEQPKKGAPPAPNPLLAQYNEMQQRALKQQKEGIGIYEQSIQDLLQSPKGQIDFTPLAALVDAWVPGSRLTQAAIAGKPMTAEQRKVLATKLQDELQRRKGDYSKAQLDAIKAQLMFGLGQTKAAEKAQVKVDDDAQKLEKRIGDMTPGIKYRLEELDKAVGGIENVESKESLPGVGPLAGLAPDVMLSDQGSVIRQHARGLVADLIKLQSGTAASEKEVDRKMEELGMGAGSKEVSFRRGILNVRNQLVQKLKSTEAAFKPEVVEAFRSRGGVTHDVVGAIGKKDKDRERLEALRKKFGGG